jgi:transcriptional regulator with XRE-family HTH domain
MAAGRRSHAARVVGRRLEQARVEAGLTRPELARRTRAHSLDVARFERGDSAPPVAHILAVAGALGVSADFLLGLSDEPRRLPPLPRDGLPAEIVREAVRLTHPDLHTPARRAAATRVTQHLNDLLDERS